MSTLRIPLARQLGTVNLELLLRQYYRDSKRSSEISFDFGATEWCEASELSLVVLWISELLAQGKRVSVFLPSEDPLPSEQHLAMTERETRADRRQRVYSFMVECLFIKFLCDQNILDEIQLAGRTTFRRPKSIGSRVSPLVFFDAADDLQGFLQSLHGNQLALAFGALADLQVVKTGEIRDVVLRELGQNLFEHAPGRFGHLLMTARSRILHVESAPAYERPFLESIRRSNGDQGSGYMTVIVSDKGPGIAKTLSDAYRLDEIMAGKTPKPSETDLIDYAFLQHSTRKTRQERLGALLQLVENEALKDSIPATGLFWVKEVARAYSALLIVRSGRSAVSYDFLTYPQLGHPLGRLITNKSDKALKTLENFGGTQIKIYFPVDPSVPRRKTFMFPFHLLEAVRSRNYEYYALSTPTIEQSDSTSTNARDWLADILDDLRRIKVSSKEEVTLVVDCAKWVVAESASAKALFLLLVELMRIQDRRFAVVVVNGKGILDRMGSYLTDIATKGSGMPKEKPILALGEDTGVSVYGLSERDSKQLASILQASPSSQGSPDQDFLRRCEHLIAFDHSSGSFITLLSLPAIRKLLRVRMQSDLALLLIDPASGIYHRNGCFLLPAGAFTDGFFELGRLFCEESWVQKLLYWIQYGIQDLRPNVLVTVGKTLGNQGETVARNLKGIIHINIPEPRKPLSAVKLALLPRNEKVVVLTDVIGTGDTVRSILASCSKLDVLAVFAVIDGREREGNEDIRFEGRRFPLDSVLSSAMHFWTKDIPSGYTYEDVIRVDPSSNSPITDAFLLKDPIWTKMDEKTGENQFVDVLKESNGIVVGHFESNTRHIIYLFRTASIVEAYGNVIAEKIREDVSKYSKVDPNLSDGSIAHVLYPQHTPAAEQIAGEISLAFSGSRVRGLTTGEIARPLSYAPLPEPLGPTVVFDDCSATGDTARRMIEFAERNGATAICVYLLCNRAEQLTSRMLQQIQRYGRASIHVRYLCELPIPTFPEDECPICRSLEALERVRERVKGWPKLESIVEEEINALRAQPIDLVLDPGTLMPYVSTPLETRLAQTQLRSWLELAKNLMPVRRRLVELVKSFRENADGVLLLFEAIAREEAYLLKDAVSFNDLFYDHFRASIVGACEHFMSSIQTMSESQALAVTAVMRLFDLDRLLDCLSVIDGAQMSERLLTRAAVQLLVSDKARRRAPYVKQIIAKWAVGANGPLLRELCELWETGAGNSPQPNAAFRAYKKALAHLSDSGPCANYFAGLEYERLPHLDSGRVEKNITSYWNEVSVLLRDEILPVLRDLADSRISRSACDRLREAVARASSLVYKSNELTEILGSTDEGGGSRTNALNGFCAAMNELHKLLLEDDDDTVPRVLALFRTDLCRIARKVVAQQDEFSRRQDMELLADIPDESYLVFGHESDVYVVVNNLVDNIMRRAFQRVSDGRKKRAVVKILGGGTKQECSLLVLDNGSGLYPGTKLGSGLTTVDEISGRVCRGWAFGGVDGSSIGTRVTVDFYRIPER